MHYSWAVTILSIAGFCHASPFQSPLNAGILPPIALVTVDEWQRFNQSVGGRLLAGTPVGLPCYNNFNGKLKPRDDALCDIVEEKRNSTGFLSTQMGGYLQGNWGICQTSGVGCPTSPLTPIIENAPCHQGAIPNFYVDVREISDVQQTLLFAAKHNIPVVVKNTGHDYKGRSAGPNTLALWIHNYQSGPVLEESFIPENCSAPVGDVVTFGAGHNFDSLYAFADKHNRIVIGGSSSTVAPAGGWITGGGHSGLSPVYGLGVDNVQQIRLVLPNGTYVTANHCQNRDIFFAVRGGGGGTFGVNMEMSVLAHPQPMIQFVQVIFPGSFDRDLQQALLSVLTANANDWYDAGWGGYAYPAGKRDSFPVLLMNPILTESEARISLAPLFDFASQHGVIPMLKTYTSFYKLYEENIKVWKLTSLGNYGMAQASRLIPYSNFEGSKNQAEIASTLTSAIYDTPGGSDVPLTLMLLLTTPSRAIKDRDSALSSAWRNSTWHAITMTVWDPSTISTEKIQKNFKIVSESLDPLRAITPDGGAYLNEGDTYEPDPITAFWGQQNYDRLLRIKNELDPHRIMQVHQGIGSDSRAPLFQCYPSVRDAAPKEEL